MLINVQDYEVLLAQILPKSKKEDNTKMDLR